MESKERMNLVLSYIDLHLQEVLSVGKIAEYVGYSEYQAKYGYDSDGVCK